MWEKTQWGKKEDLMDRKENSKSIKVGTAVVTKEITRRAGEVLENGSWHKYIFTFPP